MKANNFSEISDGKPTSAVIFQQSLALDARAE